MENLLALDQASVTTGYAIFQDKKLVKYGKITLDDPNVGTRLAVLRQTLIDMINEYNITCIAFEDIQLQASVGNNVKTFKVLANVFGVI
jgi:Holliday junction resolvasome RuvABC endonuclease subunit